MKKKKRRSEPTAAELREIIPPIPGTPEHIGRTLMCNPPKKRWHFLDKKNPPKE